MRFRTKLLCHWGGVVILMLIGTLWPVQRTIRSSFDKVASTAFVGTRHSLQSQQAEGIRRMRQAGALVMNIPELRALIAEHNYEVSADNVSSLQERLDNLRDVVEVSFVCVLDAHGSLIAQSHASPWSTLSDLGHYAEHSPQALSLMRRLFASDSTEAKGNAEKGEFGLWTYRGRIYQVVGISLQFGAAEGDQRPPTDGALIMGAPLTDELATTLGGSHSCQISFLSDGMALASSLGPTARKSVTDLYGRGSWPSSSPFDVQLGDVRYRSFLEPMIDPPSGKTVGNMLIQSSLADAEGVQQKVSRSLLIIMFFGLLTAGLWSFVLSGAVTRPVRELVRATRRVTEGELDVAMKVSSRDELGQLAAAFNEMVSGLRKQRELQQLVEESQAATRAKGQFLANMSHEIRTPLHGVIGMADLLLRTELTGQQRRYAGLVKSSAEVLTTLVNDILDFSKVEAGKVELESIDFDLHRVTRDVVELMTQRAEGKDLRLHCHIAPQVPALVSGDPTRFRQILLNLMNNAIKFTDAGEVAVRISLDEQTEDRMTARVEVQDTGVGVPTDRLDRLFKSFSQVDASTTRRFGGTGLGLAISKELVELMGGVIGVRSEEGRGSTFWFTVRFGRQQIDSLAPAATSLNVITPVHRAARILLAEDNEVNQLVASELLRASGYRCDIASNGKEAVKAAMEQEYDLILMDCQMPEMDGLEATRLIRLHEQAQSGAREGRRIPILALTANASGVVRERCENAGMDAYCSKPYEPEQLIRTVESFLQNSELRTLPKDPAASTAATRVPEAPSDIEQVPFDVQSLLRRCSGNSSLALVVLDKFEKQVAIAVANLDRLVATGDAEPLARASHALKGTAGIVAAEPLRKAAANLEELGRTSELGRSSECLEHLRQEVQRCVAYVAAAREQLSAAGPGPVGGVPCVS